MRPINFLNSGSFAINAVSTKVSSQFVSEVALAFSMFPNKVNMRFSQDKDRRLIIILTITYGNGKSQRLEGFGESDLISAILMAMGKDNHGLSEYIKEEHEIEIAAEGESLVIEIFKQYLNSTTQCYIEKDWISPKGERYRRITFTPSFNMSVKFCILATETINQLISEACKPEWMKQAEDQKAEVAA